MGLLEDNFCETLAEWKNTNFKGTQADLGKLFGVTQAQINKVLNKTRAGDETWRRMVAKKIGIPYDQMIGLNSTGAPPSPTIISLEDKEHFNITKKFKQKDRAIRINKKLVYAEQIDEDALDKIERQIDLELEDLEKKAGLKKRPAANGKD